MTQIPARHLDAQGQDITDKIETMTVAKYDATGRITGMITEARYFLGQRLERGELLVEMPPETSLIFDVNPNYVDSSSGAPVVKARVPFAGTLSPDRVTRGVEAVVAAVPACTVAYSGPVSGVFEHGGGDLAVGFTVPGTYQLSFDLHPDLPATLTLTVTP